MSQDFARSPHDRPAPRSSARAADSGRDRGAARPGLLDVAIGLLAWTIGAFVLIPQTLARARGQAPRTPVVVRAV